MAQKVHIVLTDDIDESEAEETVSFGLDGKEYAIDLNTANATALRDTLALYVAHARPANRPANRPASRSASRSASGRASRRSSPVRAAAADGPAAAEIRAWARESGFDVPERGRVSAEVREAYAAAH